MSQTATHACRFQLNLINQQLIANKITAEDKIIHENLKTKLEKVVKRGIINSYAFMGI